jgi:Tfp pilus assembly protein PilF
VLLQGGVVPPEPIAIERVCNGSPHREGFTNSQGLFQFELGRGEESNPGGSGSGNAAQQPVTDKPAGKFKFAGCEVHALLPGFQSTSLPVRIPDEYGHVDAGTISLTRLEGVTGTTLSMTSLSAPKDARQAYEKGRKAETEKKFADAEKELNKAVQVYPQYAAAWYLLGEAHRLGKQTDQAVKEYSQSITCDPQFVSPYFGLTVIAIGQQRWQDALHLSDQLTQLNPLAYPMAYFYNSAANYNLHQIEAAEKSALKFQSLDTDHQTPDVSLLMANILEAKQDYAGAAQQLRDYLAQVPNAPHAEEIKAEALRLESLAPAKPK